MASESDNLDQIVMALRRIIRAVDLHSKQLAQRYGLTGPQLVVLQYLERQGPKTTSQIATAVSLGSATLSEMLERLERKKWIRRRPNVKDRRSVLNELTPAGRAAIQDAPPLLQEHFVQQLQRLEEWERSLVLSTLQRVATMMQAEEIEASPVLVSGPLGASARETLEFHDDGERPRRASKRSKPAKPSKVKGRRMPVR